MTAPATDTAPDLSQGVRVKPLVWKRVGNSRFFPDGEALVSVWRDFDSGCWTFGRDGYLTLEAAQAAAEADHRARVLDMLEPDDGWRPIETAPQDGTEILLFASGDMAVCWWDEEDENNPRWKYFDAFYGEFTTATHWRPLPPAPRGVG